jgi:hypothetical protein
VLWSSIHVRAPADDLAYHGAGMAGELRADGALTGRVLARRLVFVQVERGAGRAEQEAQSEKDGHAASNHRQTTAELPEDKALTPTCQAHPHFPFRVGVMKRGKNP